MTRPYHIERPTKKIAMLLEDIHLLRPLICSGMPVRAAATKWCVSWDTMDLFITTYKVKLEAHLGLDSLTMNRFYRDPLMYGTGKAVVIKDCNRPIGIFYPLSMALTKQQKEDFGVE